MLALGRTHDSPSGHLRERQPDAASSPLRFDRPLDMSPTMEVEGTGPLDTRSGMPRAASRVLIGVCVPLCRPARTSFNNPRVACESRACPPHPGSRPAYRAADARQMRSPVPARHGPSRPERRDAGFGAGCPGPATGSSAVVAAFGVPRGGARGIASAPTCEGSPPIGILERADHALVARSSRYSLNRPASSVRDEEDRSKQQRFTLAFGGKS